jgi:hypothetical protein
VPFTLDSSALYAGQSWFTLALLFGISAAGFWMARQNARTPVAR